MKGARNETAHRNMMEEIDMLTMVIIVLILAFIIMLYTEAIEIEYDTSDQEQDEMDCEVISIVNKQNPGIIGYYLDCRTRLELRWFYNEH